MAEMCLSMLNLPTFGQITEQVKTAGKGWVKAFENSSYLLCLLWARRPLPPAQLQEHGLIGAVEEEGHRPIISRGTIKDQGAWEQERDTARCLVKRNSWQRRHQKRERFLRYTAQVRPQHHEQQTGKGPLQETSCDHISQDTCNTYVLCTQLGELMSGRKFNWWHLLILKA